MAVDRIQGGWADCAWFEQGVRKIHPFQLDRLEPVSAVEADPTEWLDAFRAASHTKVG